MEKNKKGAASGHKIISFFPKDPDAAETEQELLESLEREAEEAEEQLQKDPELAGLSAPGDLYARIVAELKEKGIWEEEEGEEEKTEEADGGATQSAAEIRDGEINPGTTEKCSGEKKLGATEMCSVETGLGAEGKSNEDEELNASGAPGFEDAVEFLFGQEETCCGLSESEREALELGRKILRKREQKRRRIRKWLKCWKRCGVIAASLVLVFGVAMTSEANREFAERVWNLVKTGIGFRWTLGSDGEADSIYTSFKQASADMEKIQETLGILPVDFRYLPDGTKYIQCEIREYSQSATLIYEYDDKIFYVVLDKNGLEEKLYYTQDETPILVETLISDQDIDIEIWKERQSDSNEAAYMASCRHEGFAYVIKGLESLEEIKKIAKNMVFQNSP